MSFVNWVIDSLASEDVIDLYFVLSDLKDIFLTPLQWAQQWWGDAATSQVNWEHLDQYESIEAAYNPYQAAQDFYDRTGINPYTGDETSIAKTVF